MWAITYRDIWTNGQGQQIETVHVECIAGEFEGACVIVDRAFNGAELTVEELAAAAREQGTPINASDIDG